MANSRSDSALRFMSISCLSCMSETASATALLFTTSRSGNMASQRPSVRTSSVSRRSPRLLPFRSARCSKAPAEQRPRQPGTAERVGPETVCPRSPGQGLPARSPRPAGPRPAARRRAAASATRPASRLPLPRADQRGLEADDLPLQRPCCRAHHHVQGPPTRRPIPAHPQSLSQYSAQQQLTQTRAVE